MLMIRFQRIGRKNDAAFRIAVLEKAAGPKAGKYIDLVGTYNPKTKAATLRTDAIKDWMGKGAQVSPSVHNLLVKQGAIEGVTTPKVVSKKNLEKNIAKKKAEDEAAAAKATEDAAKAEAAAAKAATEAVAEEPAEETTPVADEVPVDLPAGEAGEAAPTA